MRAHQLEHFINGQWITDDQTRSIANILVLVGGSFPAGLPLVTIVLQLDRSSTLRARSSGGSCSGAGNGSGNEEDVKKLHSCW